MVYGTFYFVLMFVLLLASEINKTGKWECLDGKRYINVQYVCNGYIHCSDGSDEILDMCALWDCPLQSWKCLDNRCIASSNVCDGDSLSFGNCKDGSDEAEDVCAYWTCTEDRWKCNDNKCILLEDVCGGYKPSRQLCSDKSHNDPIMCSKWQCLKGTWQCDDNLTCIDDQLVCDGSTGKWYGCPDGSDEAHCADIECPKDRWKCKDGSSCININNVCNSITGKSPTDCNDESDEDPDMCRNWTCSEGYWRCNDNKRCIPQQSIFNKLLDCSDGSDENVTYFGMKCPDGFHMCDNKVQCLEDKYWCDGWTGDIPGAHTCADGSDEGPHCLDWECPPNYWKCMDDLQCIHSTSVCNGHTGSFLIGTGCKDKSDEHNKLCGCEDNEWPCQDGEGCISKINVCDVSAHCHDMSDEEKGFCISWICEKGLGKCNYHENQENLSEYITRFLRLFVNVL